MSPERVPTDEEIKHKKDVDREVKSELSNISRREFLKRSGQVGLAAVGTAAVLGLAGGYWYGESSGKEAGIKEEAKRLFPRGELSPDLEIKLTDAENSVVKIQGWTAAKLREFGTVIPDFPFPIPDGEPDPENTPSSHSWIAVSKDGIYLPREEADTVGDLTSDMRTASTAAGKIDKSLGYLSGEISDFLEADLVSIRDTGETIFKAGHVVTKHQAEENGVIQGIAVGRLTPDAPLSYITFDTSKETPLPEGVSAGGFIVSK